MKDQNCAYCMKGDLLDKFGIHICDLEVAGVYLFKEQSKRGRVIVASKEHVGEVVELTTEDRHKFIDDVSKTASVLHTLFQPDKINYGSYGDTGGHLHMHLVPKYVEGDEWGSVFSMNPDKTYLTADEYEALSLQIKTALLK